MDIVLNGDPCVLESPCTVAELLAKFNVTGKFAVEINQHIIPHSEHGLMQVKDGDCIEIVQAVGGG